MSAEYDFRPRPSAPSSDESKKLYPRIVSKGTVSLDDVVDNIVSSTSFSRADVHGVITILEDKMAEYISKGYHFKLGDIGYFWGKLSSRAVEDEKQIHAQSIEFVNVNFRATSSFKKACRGQLERAKNGFKKSSDISLDECKAKINAYLKDHYFITISTFCTITGLLKSKGAKVLKSLEEEDFLSSSGENKRTIYHF